MAYIDIPSELQHVNLANLDVKDFGLATANDVSNVVVILNVYNTATANSWDYEAYLINNDQVITANYASNVLHSNATTSERVFIFNANSFSKLEIESQSFGFRYRPRSDGAVRVFVGNCRIQINNIQPANGITSYVQHRSLTDNVKSIPSKINDVSLIKNLTSGISLSLRKDISATKEYVTGINSSIVKNISSIKNLTVGIVSSITTSIISGLQQITLTCSVGLNNTQTKSISLIKNLTVGINSLIRKSISSIKNLTVGIISTTQKSISSIKNLTIGLVTSITTSIISGLQEIILTCSVGLVNTQIKSVSLIKELTIGITSSIAKNVEKIISTISIIHSNIIKNVFAIRNAISSIKSSVIKSIQKDLTFNIQMIVDSFQSQLMKLILTVSLTAKTTINKSIDKTLDSFTSIQLNIVKAVEKIISNYVGVKLTITAISDAIKNIIVPISRMMLISARDIFEKIKKRESINPVEKRDNKEKI